MRAQCRCGKRIRVTSAQCGRPIRCECGHEFEVPSLRQLRELGAEILIVEIFDNPEFWMENGCFICARGVEASVRVEIQLQPDIQEIVALESDGRVFPTVYALASFILGPVIGLAVWFFQMARKKTETVLTQAEAHIELSLFCCRTCAEKKDINSTLVRSLSSHELFLEMKEDFPQIRITNLIWLS